MSERKQFWLRALLATGIVIVAGSAAIFGLAFLSLAAWRQKGLEDDLPFRADAWRRDDPWTSPELPFAQTVRSGMGDDLRTNHLKPGMTRRAVLDLLGPPDNDDWRTERTWSYGLGTLLGGTIDPSYLLVDFDATGRLLRSKIEEG